jgi:hypothetical protein
MVTFVCYTACRAVVIVQDGDGTHRRYPREPLIEAQALAHDVQGAQRAQARRTG